MERNLLVDADTRSSGRLLCFKENKYTDKCVFIRAGHVYTGHLFGPDDNQVIGLETKVASLYDLVCLCRAMKQQGRSEDLGNKLLALCTTAAVDVSTDNSSDTNQSDDSTDDSSMDQSDDSTDDSGINQSDAASNASNDSSDCDQTDADDMRRCDSVGY